jgi:hypothetical protein
MRQVLLRGMQAPPHCFELVLQLSLLEELGFLSNFTVLGVR